MDRKSFLKKTLLGGAAMAAAPAMLKANNVKLKTSDYDKLMKEVGFNHLPNKEHKTMNTVLHKAETRGHANHGWLDAHHTFSFANYRNPERMHFGVLRVLNDDQIAGSKGFGTHPHDNMEIITIPLEGDLKHEDSMGNGSIIKRGDVQVMSAGTGIFHSEFNANENKAVKLLQIWLFPNKKSVTPRYDQISLDASKGINQFQQILSPNQDDEGVWIHQDAWFHLGEFKESKTITYKMNKAGNGLYAFVIEGSTSIQGQALNKRDGFGIWDTQEIEIKPNAGSRVLLMEVPMNI